MTTRVQGLASHFVYSQTHSNRVVIACQELIVKVGTILVTCYDVPRVLNAQKGNTVRRMDITTNVCLAPLESL